MKKRMILLGMLAGAMMLTSCGQKETSPNRIEPLPETIDINQMEDCTFRAGFEASDVYLDDEASLVVKMTVYSYEIFDMVDITQMKVGDTLVIDKNDILITSLENNGSYIEVNGGPEQGGCWLRTDDNGVYYEVLYDDCNGYYVVGQIICAVSQDFEFVDKSDLEQPEQTYYVGDFLQLMQENDNSYYPNATEVRLEGNEIINITEYFVP